MDKKKKIALLEKNLKCLCFTLKALKLIAKKYNEKYHKNIIISDNKDKLVKQLEKEIKECNEQT